MEIKVYKTDEVPFELWPSIVINYNVCFPEHKETVESLLERYRNNTLGYSYHALYYEDGEYAAYNSIMPYEYFVDDNVVVLGLSGDTYVLPHYRKNIFIFMDTFNELKKECAKDNIVAFIGVPNPNSYVYSIKFLKCKEVFKLDYWILPFKIGDVLKKKRWLNLLSSFFSTISIFFNWVISIIANSKEKKPRVRIIDNEEFLKKRLGANKYNRVVEGNYSFTYTITEDEGIRCAYIMHVAEKGERTYRALVRCVRRIHRYEKVSMVMYNGTFNLRQFLLIKIPVTLEPRKLPFTINFLSDDFASKYSFMLDPSSWDFTLLNLDVR